MKNILAVVALVVATTNAFMVSPATKSSVRATSKLTVGLGPLNGGTEGSALTPSRYQTVDIDNPWGGAAGSYMGRGRYLSRMNNGYWGGDYDRSYYGGYNNGYNRGYGGYGPNYSARVYSGTYSNSADNMMRSAYGSSSVIGGVGNDQMSSLSHNNRRMNSQLMTTGTSSYNNGYYNNGYMNNGYGNGYNNGYMNNGYVSSHPHAHKRWRSSPQHLHF